MGNDNSLLYDSYTEYYKKAMAAKDSGDAVTARKYFLLSAETLQQLALKSEGDLKAARYQTVKKLIAAASSVGDNRIRTTSSKADSVIDEDSEQFDLEIASPNDKVSFNDIIGLTEAKEAIHRKLIYPLSRPEIYKQYNLKPGGNILLEGPPGTGKTTFAKAAACEIKLPFVIVNCNALVDCLIGSTGKNIDKMFNEVRRLVRKRSTAVILFCDEFDAIAKSRTSDDKTAAEAVPSLIRQLDGFDTNNDNITIIAATNIADTLDKAILSRFNNRIYIALPDTSAREKIFVSKLKKANVREADFNAIDFAQLAAASEGLSGRDINSISMDFLNMLAERDAEIKQLIGNVTQSILHLIKVKHGSGAVKQ